MRVAVLGAGAVGGFVGAALARGGHHVVFVLRPGTAAGFPAKVQVSSRLLGDFSTAVPAVEHLRTVVDALLVTVKAPHLAAAIDQVDLAAVADGVVVPLMNGIEHVQVLRDRFGPERVVAGSIRVEAERAGPGHYRQLSPFADLRLGRGGGEEAERVEALAAALRAAGLDCAVLDDDVTLLWAKLAMLAPLALTTAAAGLSIGDVRSRPEWYDRLVACTREVLIVARADGATVRPEPVLEGLTALPVGMRSSMQKDLDAGRPHELDAIGGAVVRTARRHGLTTPVTLDLIGRVERRARSLARAAGEDPRHGASATPPRGRRP